MVSSKYIYFESTSFLVLALFERSHAVVVEFIQLCGRKTK